MTTAAELLDLVRHEATKFGRCCDLYQDGFGTFADHECQQRTFAMLRGVQQVLGVAKDGSPLSADEVAAARARAHLGNAAPKLRAALRELLEAERLLTDHENSDLTTDEQEQFDATQIYERMAIAREEARAALAEAEGLAGPPPPFTAPESMSDAEIAAQIRKLLNAYPLGTMDWPLDVMRAAMTALERRHSSITKADGPAS